MSEWSNISLGEVLTIKYGKDHKKLEDGMIPCYGTGGVMRYVEKSLSEEESILLPRKGSLNNIYYINEPFWTVDTLFWSKVDKEKAIPKYLFYAISSFDLASLNVGSAVPSLTVPVLNNLQLNLPPLPEQKAIAHILGKLDDKIELNRQMNQTLEDMAQVLFKSWFVDFDPVLDNAMAAGNKIPEALQAMAEKRSLVPDEQKLLSKNPELASQFPSSFEYNETLGKWIPEGWEDKTIDEVTALVIDHRGQTPKKLGGDWVDYGYPAISAKNVKDRKLIRQDTIRFVNEELYTKWMKEPIQKGDIIMTSEAPMGEMFFVSDDTPYCLSQRLYGLRANGIDTTPMYLFGWLHTKIARADLEARCTGTTVTGIKQSELRKVVVLSPPKLILKTYESKIDALYSKVNTDQEQTETLTQLRDTLLPQLISGKVRVPEGFVEKI
ncbi:MAG TPA: restriction endonuclease subunit S [Balneola sp.]|nr:restriction endonuclease subunit S [Balneola sp.]